MIRGAIDYLDSQAISGWLHSDEVAVRGRTVLAFVDDHCVGAGVVDRFRQDLADAGVGDGFGGFHFGVTLPQGCALARLVVKLENSDLILLQPGCRLAGHQERHRPTSPYSVATIEWMHDRGWLAGDDLEFLRTLAVFGFFEFSLHAPSGELLDAEPEAQRLFELLYRRRVALVCEPMPLAELARRRGELIDTLVCPVVAIHAPGGSVAILEGSHELPFELAPSMHGAVKHGCGADRLLFVDLRSALVGEGLVEARVFRIA